MKKKISIILGIAENMVIGNNDVTKALPWRLPRDMNYFKKTTIGDGRNGVFMGRKTWDTIPEKFRPLGERENMVISATVDFVHDNVKMFRNMDEVHDYFNSEACPENIFIAGGLQVYRRFMPFADELYLTKVHAEVDGDVVFDDFNLDNWEEIWSERHEADDKNAYALTFARYIKKN